MNIKNTAINHFAKPRNLFIVEVILCLPFLIIPFFIKLPYRINIFLSWEGSYRLFLGQTPYEDFGMPIGFGYWLIPSLFFKIFGPTMLSLIKAQFFINIVSLLSLRAILRILNFNPYYITLSLFVFCLSFIINNFWPWYNHSVVIYELVSILLILSFIQYRKNRYSFLLLIGAGFITFLTVFTKQDVGGICFVLCLTILVYNAFLEKDYLPIFGYLFTFFLSGFIFIAPHVKNDFFYWFNLGQPPHNSRLDLSLLINLFLSESTFIIKLYLGILLIGIISHVNSIKEFFYNKSFFLLNLICVAMILQSFVTLITSPIPPENSYYYHTFGFIGIVNILPLKSIKKNLFFSGALLLGIALTYSGGFWRYASVRVFSTQVDETANTTIVEPWVEASIPTLKGILVPQETNEGIARIMALPFLDKKELKVLNMSELTSLAREIGYEPLKNQPLWYHLNIGIFDKEVEELALKIEQGYYDVILFEDVPSLTEFYPYALLKTASRTYTQIDTFKAPRKLDNATIYVFIHPDLSTQYGLSPVDGPTNQHP